MQTKVCAIVVTYNRKELLLECVNALFAQTYSVHEVMIVDNASTDGTYEYLVANGVVDRREACYHNTGSNLGGAGGFHFGIREAYAGDGELFWIMDDDTVPTKTALEELLKVYEGLNDEKLGYLCSNVKWTDGNACNMNIPHKTDRWIDTIDKGYIEIIKCTFVSVLIKKNVVGVVGLPIKEFFIWGDDTEYTRRISLDGYKAYLAYNSIVVHKMKENGTPNILTDDTSRIGRHFYRYRNTVYIRIRKKYFGKAEVKRAKKKIRKDFWGVIFKADNKKARLSCLLKGVWAGYRFHPVVEGVTGVKE